MTNTSTVLYGALRLLAGLVSHFSHSGAVAQCHSFHRCVIRIMQRSFSMLNGADLACKLDFFKKNNYLTVSVCCEMSFGVWEGEWMESDVS